jgi:cell wall-associated NlpC family hydrolase
MRLARAGLLLLLVAISGCGMIGPNGSAPRPSSTPSTSASASPIETPSPAPTPLEVRIGAPAWVWVSVATLWRSPSSPRAVDGAALGNPARIREWLASLSTSDQAGLIDRADSQILLGTLVDVLSLSGGWAQVVVPDQSTPQDVRGYPGWVPVAQLSAQAQRAAASSATVVSPTAWLSRGGINVMEVSFGTRLPVIAVRGSTVELGLPDQAVLDANLSSVIITLAGDAALPASAASLVDTARKFLGLRYLWAGTSGFGYDCSGLMYAIFKAHGVTLPRDAQDQAAVGLAVDRQSLQPGDLVFLARNGAVRHVALYVGSGMVLDSPDLGKGAQTISIAAEPHSSEFSGARRVLP